MCCTEIRSNSSCANTKQTHVMRTDEVGLGGVLVPHAEADHLLCVNNMEQIRLQYNAMASVDLASHSNT